MFRQKMNRFRYFDFLSIFDRKAIGRRKNDKPVTALSFLIFFSLFSKDIRAKEEEVAQLAKEMSRKQKPVWKLSNGFRG